MAFYSRIIKLQGASYKQISFDAWQNLTTGEILDNTRMSGIINLVADRAVVPTVPAVILGACCTGGICVGDGQTAQDFCPPSVGIFYPGSTCAECLLGACCTGGTCYGGQLTSQSVCNSVGGIFYLGLTCNQCETGVFCTGGGSNRTCIRTGYRGEQLSNEFQPGATCSYCIMGTCCINGEGTVGVRQSNCTGVFFAGIFNLNACDSGSCCLGGTCNENIFRYNCAGVFNSGQTCLACSSGACCLPSGCTFTTQGNCTTLGGTFFGGATCSACDTGVCCNNGICTDQRRGNVCAGTFYAGANCSSTPCEKGACCTGGNCISNTDAINCQNINGTFFSGVTCIACATGANCLSELELNGDRACVPNEFFGNVIDGTFYQNQGCSACQTGVCCNSLGGGTGGIRGDCTGSATFYAGQTLFICDAGVFCTGSNEGQTCFGLGHRGQSLTNNFIAGATCNACILGACCTGGTCLGGGLTSQAACSSAGGLFFAGKTCTVCDYGVYCTGATCLSLGYRGQSLSNNFIKGATCSSCILGACCTGGTCSGGGQTSQAACNGLFYAGATCRTCDYGVYCTGATCFDLGFRGQSLTGNFIVGATCSSCILGACCTGGTCFGGGQTSQAACLVAGGTFYAGSTCSTCVTGVFCTGSNEGQTCFGLGHRGQSLTNNFVAGGTCSSCILGACCTGGSCLGGGLTSQAACSAVGGLFYAGTTCVSCDYGVYCTGSNETTSCLGLGYRAQNLSNQFVISGSCVLDCVYGSCCQGTTCLGITNQGNCNRPNSFFAGMTCAACDTGTGACCTGGNSSITTITGCEALGGIFFPDGTTALCVTGSCCTGGTCTEEIVGRSGNCQLFIAGATCSICDTGVYCTGATCLQTGFRGQSLTSNFIVGATCNSCILGMCCTGGTCIGGGQTAQINCPSNIGSFVIGATQCTACANNVNCCVGGTHSYILAEQCISLGGIVFEGSEDPLTCESGAFCTGATCAGVTLYGYSLSNNFVVAGDCSYCILGTCCGQDNTFTYTTQADCKGVFTPGINDPTYCSLGGLTYGICCTGGTCSSNTDQSDCDGYFISNANAATYNLTCETNACEIGVCCGESNVTSVTGGVCLGVMTRAECTVTGGDFFSISEGYTCSNCLYIPMLASAVFEKIATSSNQDNTRQTRTRPVTETGFTGNEIQPRSDDVGSGDTWIVTNQNLHGAGATTAKVSLYRGGNTGGSQTMYQGLRNFSKFHLWYNSGITLHEPANSALGKTVGVYDAPPDFSLGLTSANGATLGYILGAGDTQVYQVPRYLKLTIGYNNPSDLWYGQSIVYRWYGNVSSANWAQKDATVHAQVPSSRNTFPNPTPFADVGEFNPSVDYSSPILAQVFAENPLKYRSRAVGSCCKGITCLGILTEDHCQFTGGTFYENSTCTSCYPELIIGNCCTGGTYYGYTAQSYCLSIGGYFKKGTTTDKQVCVYGSECNTNETCIAGNIYFGQYTGGVGATFVSFDYSENLGCSACDRGICCVGLTCNGYIPRATCDSLSGTFYENESSCGDICNVGVCCNIDTGGCGTYTNAGNCRQPNQVFFLGYTQGQTCSACTSLLTLTSNSSGVTFSFTLNKGTTYGTFYDGTYWVQETEGLKLVHGNLQYMTKNSNLPDGSKGSTLARYSGNTRIRGLTLTSNGYKGTVYVHGMAKNPPPLNYYKQDGTYSSNNDQPFNSISFYEYNGGWIGNQGSSSTENPNNYDDFDLLKFEENRLTMVAGGMTLSGTDVIIFNCSNFDVTKPSFSVKNNAGYPYQVETERANTLAYGILNCISATAAALAGSTVCFRPPNQWPEEDKINRPIYPISLINNKVPGTPGNTLIQMTTSNKDTRLTYSIHTARSPSQFSEFGFGVEYPVTAPLWAMHGRDTESIDGVYGEQYMFPLHELLYSTWAFRASGLSLTFEQRRDGIARIVQYGLDAYGPCKIFCTNLASGAGQKAGRTRGWIPIAGYFLGVTAMYDVEATLLNDTNRLNSLMNNSYVYNNLITDTPGRTCVSFAEWNRFRFGGTGPEDNYLGTRRFLSNILSHETNTMVEVVNDPSNLVRHYEYLGSIYRGTTVAGFGPTGATGITFYNADKSFKIDVGADPDGTKINVSGNFGVMQWGNTSSWENPYPGRFSYSSKEGDASSFNSMWVKVESGPGAGNTYYKVLHMLGSFRPTDNNATSIDPAPNSQGGGFQIILGSTWTYGIPDHTSVLNFYPLVLDDTSITRPSSFDVNGVTGCVIYVKDNGPRGNCPASNKSESRLYDANSSPTTPYFTNSLDAWAPQWLFVDYIERTKGISLNSKAIPMADYAKQYIYTSPYNIMGLYAWDTGFNSVFAAFAGADLSSTAQRDRINFTKYYPGITSWKYV